MVNKVIMIGNLTRAPEVRYTANKGTPAARFGLAVNERYKSGDELKEETLFIEVECYGNLAKNIGEYGHKGMMVYVEGSLKKREWEQDGEKKFLYLILAENIRYLKSKKEN